VTDTPRSTALSWTKDQRFLWRYATVRRSGTLIGGFSLDNVTDSELRKNMLFLILHQKYCHNVKQQYKKYFPYFLLRKQGPFPAFDVLVERTPTLKKIVNI
jgi:hypothetical protein